MDRAGYEAAPYDAYHLERSSKGLLVHARLDGKEHVLTISDGSIRYEGQGVMVDFDAGLQMLEAEAVSALPEATEVDLGVAFTMMMVSRAQHVIPAV